jgi:hypothetical protein
MRESKKITNADLAHYRIAAVFGDVIQILSASRATLLLAFSNGVS